jgi:hypothetical protein
MTSSSARPRPALGRLAAERLDAARLTARAPLRALLRCDYRLERFCCCSLEVGVALTTLLLFVNACLAFAGEAALYLGLAGAVAAQVTGALLPPGSPLASYGLHGVLIGLGIYALAGAIFGAVALARRSARAAVGLYVVMYVDVVLSIAVAVISWLAGSPFNVLLAQLPTFALNVYLLAVVGSYRAQLARALLPAALAAASGGAKEGGAGTIGGEEGLDAGVEDDDLDLDLGSSLEDDNDVSNGAAGGAARGGHGGHGSAAAAAAAAATAAKPKAAAAPLAAARPKGPAPTAVVIGDLDDEEDGDAAAAAAAAAKALAAARAAKARASP